MKVIKKNGKCEELDNSQQTKNSEPSLFESLWHFVATDRYADFRVECKPSKLAKTYIDDYVNMVNILSETSNDYTKISSTHFKLLNIFKNERINKNLESNMEKKLNSSIATLRFFTNENYEKSREIFYKVFDNKDENNEFLKLLKTIKITNIKSENKDIVGFGDIFDLDENVVLATQRSFAIDNKNGEARFYNGDLYCQINPIISIQFDIYLNVLQIITLKLQETDYIKFRYNNFLKDGLPYSSEIVKKICRDEIKNHPIYSKFYKSALTDIVTCLQKINESINHNYIGEILDYYYKGLDNFSRKNQKMIVEYDYQKIIDAFHESPLFGAREQYLQTMKGKNIPNKTEMSRNKLIIYLNKILSNIPELNETKTMYQKMKHYGNKNLKSLK